MKVQLEGGAYESRSVVASSQRCLNLYQEPVEQSQGEANTSVYLPTPGLKLFGTCPTKTNGTGIRCIYEATSGEVFCVNFVDVYQIKNSKLNGVTFTWIGSLHDGKYTPVKMIDNGNDILICDGSPKGWTINLKTKEFKKIDTGTNTGWAGSTIVDYSDTYFITAKPNTYVWQVSDSLDTNFGDDFASKVSYPDKIVASVAVSRNVWLIGETTAEIWYNSGGGGLGTTSTGDQTNVFPYQLTQGQFEDTGCIAPYSVAKTSNAVFWLATTRQNEIFVVRGMQYRTDRISNTAIENQILKYSKVSDAEAFIYRQGGHIFYVLHFPSVDKTWVYDNNTGRWHERCTLDRKFRERRWLGRCYSKGLGFDLVGDWNSGSIYSLDIGSYTDVGVPIKRVRSFPQIVDTDKNVRISYRSFTADMDVGETTDFTTDPLISLRWSSDKGKTWNNPRRLDIGKVGQTRLNLKASRLGTDRNRIFEIEWACDCFTSLSGAYMDVDKLGT